MQTQLKNIKDKTCDTGYDLWEKYLNSGEQADYQAYIDHVRSCQKCFEKERALGP